ncbi:hypothetical protein PFISCL1PPCAC_4520, partial [Pristionchus fissidentatus]
EKMHIRPSNSGLGRSEHSSVSSEYSIVHKFLILGELSIGGERSCDTGTVAVVLGSHIEQAHVSILDLLIIRCIRMTIVENRSITSTGCDASVREVPAAARVVRRVAEDTVGLVFVQSRFDVRHRRFVRVRGDFRRVSKNL